MTHLILSALIALSFHSDVAVSALSIPRAAPPAGYEDEVLMDIGVYQNPFPDTDMASLQGRAAAELYRRAVVGGFPDGEFKGDRPVNRAEAAKFLLLARYGAVEDIANSGRFSDVLDGQWYVRFVVTAATKGIIDGYQDGSFRPAATVNTVEFLKMLSLTFNLQEHLPYPYGDVDTEDWFAPYAGVAQAFRLFPDRTDNLLPDRLLTRKDVAIAIYQFLQNRTIEAQSSSRTSLPSLSSSSRSSSRHSSVPGSNVPPSSSALSSSASSVSDGFTINENLPAIDAGTDHIRGTIGEADIGIVIYSDFECPFCVSMNEKAKELMTIYGGKLAWVARSYPLSFHPYAQEKAEAAECVAALGGNGAFWSFSDLLFADTGLTSEELNPLVTPLGVNQTAFDECLQSGRFEQLVQDAQSGGSAAGVRGTPTTFVVDLSTGRSKLISGSVPLEVFQEAIDPLLE
jgi:protein-disulfide isomerase